MELPTGNKHTNSNNLHLYFQILMRTVHPSFQSYLPLIKRTLKKYNVANAYVFGSVLTERINDNSDIDLLINFRDYSNPLAVGQKYLGFGGRTGKYYLPQNRFNNRKSS